MRSILPPLLVNILVHPFLMSHAVRLVLIPGITVAAADRFDAGMHIQMALIRISGHEPFPTLFTLKCLSRLFSMVAPDVTVKVVLVVEQLSTLRAGQCWGK